jgi:hypothetical protein
MLLTALWIAAFLVLFGGVPEPLQVFVGATVDYLRSVSVTVFSLCS